MTVAFDRGSLATRLPAAATPVVCALLVLLGAIVLPNVVDSYVESVAFQALLLVTVASGWNLLGGYGGQPSFGHAAFWGVGAYAASISMGMGRLPVVLAVLIGGAAASLLAVVVIPCFRARGVYFSIITLALAQTVGFIGSRVLPGGTSGMTLPFVFQIDSHQAYYYALATAVAAVAVTVLTLRTKTGLSLQALASDIDAAETVGVPTLSVRAIALALSACLTGFAGALYALDLTFVDPAAVFDPSISILAILATILGGSGTVIGPVLGAAGWTLLTELVRGLPNPGAYTTIVYGLALLILALFLPGGVVGLIHGDRIDRWRQSCLPTKRMGPPRVPAGPEIVTVPCDDAANSNES